jgi:branched-chain amino acid transport system substrate-binding protein
VSVPITNDAGILQVSPADGLTSLTRTPIGRPRAGPERYYPADRRSFLRLVPDDELEAEVLLDQVRQAGARRMAVLYDGDIHGRELGAVLVALGRRDGPEPVASEEYRDRVEEIPDVVGKLADERPDVVVYAGVASPGTGLILAEIRRVLQGVPVYATLGLLARDPARPIPLTPETVHAVGAIPPADELPAEGRRVLARLRRRESTAVARPEAAYGYEAMRVVLDSIRAGGANRAKVIRNALHIDRRRSPIGPFSVRATGEVDTARFWLYTLQNGRFDFDQMVD